MFGQIESVLGSVVQQRDECFGSAGSHGEGFVPGEGVHYRQQCCEVICWANSTEAAARAACPRVEFIPASRRASSGDDNAIRDDPRGGVGVMRVQAQQFNQAGVRRADAADGAAHRSPHCQAVDAATVFGTARPENHRHQRCRPRY